MQYLCDIFIPEPMLDKDRRKLPFISANVSCYLVYSY